MSVQVWFQIIRKPTYFYAYELNMSRVVYHLAYYIDALIGKTNKSILRAEVLSFIPCIHANGVSKIHEKYVTDNKII